MSKKVVQNEESFKITVIDSAELNVTNLKKKGLVVAVSNNSHEVWFDFDLNKNKIIIKIPKKSGHPQTYELTLNQFIKLISSKKSKNFDF